MSLKGTICCILFYLFIRKVTFCMKASVSVIVPVYNVEKYLAKCIDSLLGQSMSDIEILLINDGSSDNCGDICDQYAKIDSRIKVVHQENKGISITRNTGIKLATADYLMFVDSDDYVSPDFCKRAYETITKKKSDIVMFQYQENEKHHAVTYSDKSSGYIEPQEAVFLMLNGYGHFIWNKIYKKELFNNILFPPNKTFEDHVTTPKLLLEAKSIYFINDVLYYYCPRQQSITRIISKDSLINRFSMIYEEYTYLLEHKIDRTVVHPLLFYTSLYYCSRMSPGGNDQYYRIASDFLHNTPVSFKRYGLKSGCQLFLFKYMPSVYNFLLDASGRKLS